ncbi:hypothetical protein DFH09DRAFT_1313787 [Mycena vulgaris]|nr:hypothetical protein DFH09DRAFT_1313777 [Mycena vulgaris]KAJ6568334.1 hypothetical protein DFH09DRAFT_1313787 [Mycena vulgaris]
MDTVDNVIPEPDKLAEIDNLIAPENPPKAPEKMANTPNENHPPTAPQKPVNMPKPKEKKKRGSPGDFQGQRLHFLLAFMPSYVAKSKNKIRKKRGTADNIWDEFFVNYWSSFPWHLPLSQDPSEDGVDYARPPVDEEERAAKTELMQKTESKIKSWFNRQQTAVGLAGNPFSEWLSRLQVPEGPAPRRLPDYQFYMQHSDHKAKVTTLFLEQHADTPAREHLKLRCDVARELLEGENQAVKDEIREAAATEHAEQMAVHEDALKGLPALDEEGQHEAREHFSTLVAPLLAGLKAHMGYEISLFAGRVDAVKGLDVQVMSLHAGVTNDTPTHKDLSKADPKAYGEMLMHFFAFYLRIA